MRSKISRGLAILGILLSGLGFSRTQARAENRHDLFSAISYDYIHEGQINFKGLCQDERLSEYITQLNRTDPETIAQDNDRFAFWLNVYNAYSLAAVCQKYPIKNINELNFGGLIVSVVLKKSVWDRPFVMVNNQTHTLREVDHEILRPRFKDPRIQFAIACGAVGCAPARSQAYEGDLLDQQLEDQTRIFINNPELNSFDSLKKTAELSPLFNWSKKEFGENDREVILFIAKYLPEDQRSVITSNPDGWKIKYKNYDLTLSDAKN